jgi:hypothetical protein
MTQIVGGFAETIVAASAIGCGLVALMRIRRRMANMQEQLDDLNRRCRRLEQAAEHALICSLNSPGSSILSTGESSQSFGNRKGSAGLDHHGQMKHFRGQHENLATRKLKFNLLDAFIFTVVAFAIAVAMIFVH